MSRPAAAITVVLLLIACGGVSDDASPSPASTTSTVAPGSTPVTTESPPITTESISTSITPVVQRVDLGGYEVEIACEGQGDPTVVFVAGAGSDRFAFIRQIGDLRDEIRVCAYDRGGIGGSDNRPEIATLGDLADELAGVLDGAEIEGPVIVVGHSLGGAMIALFATRYPDRVAGIVLVDAMAVSDYVDRFGPTVADGTTTVDVVASVEEWVEVTSFGSTPTVVLTQGFAGPDAGAPQEFREMFRGEHDRMAALSSNAIHVVADDSGHMIQEMAPALVTAVIVEVVEAVSDGSPLEPCDERFDALGGSCR